MRRQPPPDTVYADDDPTPDGYVRRWVADDAWRLATPAEYADRLCRRPGCQRAPVAALHRSNGWWLYCDWHLYGHRIHDGVVESRRLVPEAVAT